MVLHTCTVSNVLCLQMMGPDCLLSGAPSTVGSGGSSEWGREYEDEDTWYEFTSAYQSGVDTYLLPSQDTGKYGQTKRGCFPR